MNKAFTQANTAFDLISSNKELPRYFFIINKIYFDNIIKLKDELVQMNDNNDTIDIQRQVELLNKIKYISTIIKDNATKKSTDFPSKKPTTRI